jgi:hypothetical protein
MSGPLSGLKVSASEYMAGAKKAVLCGGTVHVSPAMWALMKDATPEELEHLLRNLPCLVLPPPPALDELSGMMLTQTTHRADHD